MAWRVAPPHLAVPSVWTSRLPPQLIRLHVRRDDLLGSLNHVAKVPPLTLLCGAVRIAFTGEEGVDAGGSLYSHS